jgi:hypothetical protein
MIKSCGWHLRCFPNTRVTTRDVPGAVMAQVQCLYFISSVFCYLFLFK